MEILQQDTYIQLACRSELALNHSRSIVPWRLRRDFPIQHIFAIYQLAIISIYNIGTGPEPCGTSPTQILWLVGPFQLECLQVNRKWKQQRGKNFLMCVLYSTLRHCFNRSVVWQGHWTKNWSCSQHCKEFGQNMEGSGHHQRHQSDVVPYPSPGHCTV